jgi:hypothetical protein
MREKGGTGMTTSSLQGRILLASQSAESAENVDFCKSLDIAIPVLPFSHKFT